MKQNVITGFVAVVALLTICTACSSDLDSQAPNRQGSNKIYLTSQFQSMRSTGDPQGSNLAENTEVGVFGTDGTTALNSNEKYKVNASNGLDAVTANNEMCWPADDATTVNVYAYAPYQESWTVDGSNVFSVQADQTEDEKYLASDLVWATASKKHSEVTEDIIPLAFSHLLAKVNITISKATGSNVNLAGATVYILGTITSATVNAKTGVVTVSEGTSSQITAATISADLTAGDNTSKASACAVIIPQDLVANTTFVKIVTTAENGSKTLIAKLGSATTFAANTSYNLSVSVGSAEDNSTKEIILDSSTTVLMWGDESTLGQTPYGIGDYVLKDGTFLKGTDDDFATKKSDAIAVIFSTKVSSTDATRGYNAYAMGLATLGSKNWGGSNDWPGSNISGWSEAYADLDGLEKNASILNYSTYNGLSSDAKVKVLANLSNYTLSVDDGVTNLSGWFTPSIGQMIQILNGLGNAGLTESTGYIDGNTSSPGWGYKDNGDTAYGTSLPEVSVLLAVQNKINDYVTNAGKSAFGNNLYATVTESSNNFWQVSFQADKGYNIGRNPGKTGSDRIVIPCIAIKNLPIASE